MMRNIRQAGFLVTLFLLCAGIGRPQVITHSPVSAASDKELATLYVYRLDDGIVGLWFIPRKLPIYFGERANTKDEQKKMNIARLSNKRYFMMRLPQGKYVFDTKMMWGHLDLEVVAAGEYYLRADRGNDCPEEDYNNPLPPRDPLRRH